MFYLRKTCLNVFLCFFLKKIFEFPKICSKKLLKFKKKEKLKLFHKNKICRFILYLMKYIFIKSNRLFEHANKVKVKQNREKKSLTFFEKNLKNRGFVGTTIK